MNVLSTPVRRSVVASGAALAIVLLGGLTCASAEAGTLTRVTETFSDPFGDSFSCDGFSAHYVGQDHGFVMTWYDANGDPVRQESDLRDRDRHERQHGCQRRRLDSTHGPRRLRG